MFGYEKPTARERYEAIQEHLDAMYSDMEDEIETLDRRVNDLHDKIEELNDEIYMQKDRINSAYTQRAIAAIAFAHTVLSLGGTAGIGRDGREDQPDEWRVVLYVDTPAGQMSWHIAPADQAMLEGLPQYTGTWDGNWNSADLAFYKRFVNAKD